MSVLMLGLCIKCGAQKPTGVRCRECHRAESRCRYMNEPERWVGYAKNRLDNNPDSVRKARHKYNVSPHGRVKTKAYNESWRIENPEYPAEWRSRNPESARRATSRYRANKLSVLGSHTDAEWQLIVARQKGRCLDCGLKAKLERDHRIPISLGGSDYATNIDGRCRSCNAAKSNRIAQGAQVGIFDLVSGPVGG